MGVFYKRVKTLNVLVSVFNPWLTTRESFCGLYSPILVLVAGEKGGQLLLDFFIFYFISISFLILF